MGDSEEEVKGKLKTFLSRVKNGTKLAGSLILVLVLYFVEVMKFTDESEVQDEDPEEMEEAAYEAWQQVHGEPLPKALAHRVRKWAGEVVTYGGKSTKETPLAGPSVGEISGTNRLDAARKEVADMGLSPFEEEKAIKDMAEQGLSLIRIVCLSYSIVLGKVCSLSMVAGCKYGEDPALSDDAKKTRKAGKKMLSNIISEKNFPMANSYFSDLMRGFSTYNMSEESSLVGTWWAETVGCFQQEKDQLFVYLDQYFDKYAGRGLPTAVDTVLMIRQRMSSVSSGSVTKEDLKTLKNRLDSLETQAAKQKTEISELKQRLNEVKTKTKPTPEEQEARRAAVTCNICKKKGHYASECPDKKEE